MSKSTVLAITALFAYAFGVVSLIARLEPFMYNFYAISWWSYILFVDALLSFRSRGFLIANRNFPYLVIVSSAFWCLFEVINLRIKNWFYINTPDHGIVRYMGYLIAFGTVIPGIYVTKEAIQRFVGDVRIGGVAFTRRQSALFISGFVILILTVLFPNVLFALTWVFLIPIMDVINYRLGYSSFLRDLERGKIGAIISTGLAGMVCGFFWEVWNYWAVTKWVYSVPLVEDLKLFEMPILGYLGFAFFAVETIAFVNSFRAARLFRTHAWIVVLVALAFSFGTFALIERYTVFSRLARADQLTFIPDETRQKLEEQGIRYGYAIDMSLLNNKDRAFLNLVQLKGLGLDHALLLKERGIDTVAGLASLSPAQMCTIIGEPQKRRCRVYVKAAGGRNLDY